jgi:hypothetical protein
VIAVFMLFWLPAAMLSRGFPEADGYSHYLCARFAFQIPSNFTDVWARPFCTALYSLPAVLGGRFGICCISALVAIGCGIVSLHLAREQQDRLPVLALIFTLAQPVLFVHSLSAMTELPFALLLGLSFLAFSGERFGVAALLASLLPLTRPEGFGFVLIAGGWLIYRRKFIWLAILPLPLLASDVIGWTMHGRIGPWWHWLASQWPYSAQSMYGHGSWLTFVTELPIVVSPLIFPATLLGIWLSVGWVYSPTIGTLLFRVKRWWVNTPNLQLKNQQLRANDRAWERLATAFIPLFVLFVHTVLYATGKLGSYGEPRYLLIASPFWGVLSARGWEWCFTRLKWKHTLRWGAVAALTPLLINAIQPAIPLRPPADCVMAQRVADWVATSGVRKLYPHLLCSHMAVFYSLGISPQDSAVRSWDRETILHAPAATVLIWDPTYGPLNASSDRAVTVEEIRGAGWIEDVQASPLRDPPAAGWHIFHSVCGM